MSAPPGQHAKQRVWPEDSWWRAVRAVAAPSTRYQVMNIWGEPDGSHADYALDGLFDELLP